VNRKIIHSTSSIRAMRWFLKKHVHMASSVRSSLTLLAADAFELTVVREETLRSVQVQSG
jgi:hypothetical protein